MTGLKDINEDNKLGLVITKWDSMEKVYKRKVRKITKEKFIAFIAFIALIAYEMDISSYGIGVSSSDTQHIKE